MLQKIKNIEFSNHVGLLSDCLDKHEEEFKLAWMDARENVLMLEPFEGKEEDWDRVDSIEDNPESCILEPLVAALLDSISIDLGIKSTFTLNFIQFSRESGSTPILINICLADLVDFDVENCLEHILLQYIG